MPDLTAFYWVLALCAVVLTGAMVMVAYKVIQTLEKVEQLVQHTTNIVADVRSIKDSVKFGVVQRIAGALQWFSKK